MTLPDPSQDRSGGDDQGQIDRLPPSQRNQDQLRTETSHGLAVDGSRPLTAEERAAAEHDSGVAERVYAPASERVPVEPVPGHRDFVVHTDPSTPERQAAQSSASSEPSFTRVERPSTNGLRDWNPTMSTPYSSSATDPSFYAEPMSGGRGWMGLPIGIGSVAAITCGAIGVWMYMRWQRQRNRPINRIRRQAWQTASDIRNRVPSSADELRQPGYGAAASLLPIGLVLWRMMQSRERRPIERVTDTDWQHRLMSLKDRWSARRLELEKISISRH